MAKIVFADKTGCYDGRYLDTHPLGATESSVIRLARELARRNHDVTVYTNCDGPLEHDGVRWRPLSGARPEACDLHVAAQHTELLGFARTARCRALWVLWQPNHLEHYSRIWRMWRYHPVPVFTSLHQTRIYAPRLRRHVPEVADDMRDPPPRLPRKEAFRPYPLRRLRQIARIGRLRRLAELGAASVLLPQPDPQIVIPLGLPDDVRGLPPLPAPPARRAIFASNPVRNLHRLVEIWAGSILPRVPDAVLDVYGVHDLGTADAWQAWEGRFLPAGLPRQVTASVRVHATATRRGLIDAMRSSRVMLYLGHECEAFCLALAEAQALGVPAVVAPVAALPERVIDGVTGFHCASPAGFADAAVSLLTDDDLWRRQHAACLRLQQGITWSENADRFETALLDRHAWAGGPAPAAARAIPSLDSGVP